MDATISWNPLYPDTISQIYFRHTRVEFFFKPMRIAIFEGITQNKSKPVISSY